MEVFMGRIRLACRFCDSDEFDFVEILPSDWFAVEEVQSFEASVQQITRTVDDRSVIDWFTHLGICPECYEAEIQQHKVHV
jgi:hypothetical protein